MRKNTSKIKGFSLIELLFVVAILGILIGLALPGFTDTVEAANTNSQIKVMLTTLNLARSEAIKRGQDVSICASSDGADCDAANWTEGWIVFVDNNGDANGAGGSVDGGDEVIRVFDTLGAGSTGAFTVNMFSYNDLGFSSTGGTQQFTVTPASGSVDNTRCIEIGPSGRGRRVEGAAC
ncbi:MAG: GspH/FimT family pseudopilin [Pseudomonadales bacterium]|nr:GspH/FimT family pseudopilin [Pseudomonadales bacterium]